MAVIETKRLSKTYGKTQALQNLTLTVEKGQLFGFIGPNGAGKTTTINILTGQLNPTSGGSTVLGIDPVLHPKRVRNRIGILPEREDPPSFLTPREYFSFVGDIRDIPGVEDRAEEWADRLLFRDKLDTLNKDLSKGERQKVMITQAFLHEPELAFIDEPLINLDPIVQERIKEHFTSFVEKGNTIFLSTHVMSLAEEVCTDIGIIHRGELVTQKAEDEIHESGETLADAFLRIINDQDPEGDD